MRHSDPYGRGDLLFPFFYLRGLPESLIFVKGKQDLLIRVFFGCSFWIIGDDDRVLGDDYRSLDGRQQRLQTLNIDRYRFFLLCLETSAIDPDKKKKRENRAASDATRCGATSAGEGHESFGGPTNEA